MAPVEVVAQITVEALGGFDLVRLCRKPDRQIWVGDPRVALLSVGEVNATEPPRVIVVVHPKHGGVPDHLGMHAGPVEDLGQGNVFLAQGFPSAGGEAIPSHCHIPPVGYGGV